VATGLLAGVIGKLVLLPPVGLAEVALTLRLAAIAAGLVAFLALGRSMFIGVLVGEAVLIAGAFWFG
jgi:hypothetical protein